MTNEREGGENEGDMQGQKADNCHLVRHRNSKKVRKGKKSEAKGR